eukprot:2602793-Rhodomonas_salina.1
MHTVFESRAGTRLVTQAQWARGPTSARPLRLNCQWVQLLGLHWPGTASLSGQQSASGAAATRGPGNMKVAAAAAAPGCQSLAPCDGGAGRGRGRPSSLRGSADSARRVTVTVSG